MLFLQHTRGDGQVLPGHARALEDVRAIVAAGDFACDHRAHGDEIVLCKGSIGDGKNDVTSLAQGGGAVLDDDLRPAHQGRIELSTIRLVRSHGHHAGTVAHE